MAANGVKQLLIAYGLIKNFFFIERDEISVSSITASRTRYSNVINASWQRDAEKRHFVMDRGN